MTNEITVFLGLMLLGVTIGVAVLILIIMLKWDIFRVIKTSGKLVLMGCVIALGYIFYIWNLVPVYAVALIACWLAIRESKKWSEDR